MENEKYNWSCPRPDCRRTIVTFTEGGMRLLSQEHILQHMREDRKAAEQTMLQERTATLHGVTAKSMQGSQLTHAIEVIYPKNYDVLKLTTVDRGFLKTRGVLVDGKIELDLSDPKPSKDKDSLGQGAWYRILCDAWPYVPPKDDNGKPE